MSYYIESLELKCPKCNAVIHNYFEYIEDCNEQDTFEVTCEACNHEFFAYYTVELMYHIEEVNDDTSI